MDLRTRPGRRSRIRRGTLPALLLFLHLATQVQAVELGNLRVHSLLGRQLKASIPLTGDDARESEARCFKAALVNLSREPLSTLKVTLQHFSNGSVLLLSGGAAIDEPAAMVVVENSCGIASSREYALLLDPAAPAAPTEAMKEVATATPTPSIATNGQAERKPGAVEHRDDLKNRKAAVRSAFLYAIPGMPTMKMAAMLADVDRDSMVHPGPDARPPALMDSPPHALLRMDRSLGGAELNGVATSHGQKAWIIGALSLIALFGAAAWIALRIREMRASARPWIPGETPSEDSDANARTASAIDA